jgi:hypothetical protein
MLDHHWLADTHAALASMATASLMQLVTSSATPLAADERPPVRRFAY